MDEPVAQYIEAIAGEHRPLSDRIHDLILAQYADASVVLSYGGARGPARSEGCQGTAGCPMEIRAG